MAIYLDTGVICRWRNFDTFDRLALSIAADQLDQQIVVPELVVEEAMAHRERDLIGVIDRFHKAEGELKSHFGVDDVHSEPAPDVGRQMRDWLQQLEGFGDVLSMNPADMMRALKREVRGQAPAKARTPNKPGSGARDAAIWLAALSDHRSQDETGFFVTTNSKDFLDGEDLRPGLVEDLVDLKYPLEVRIGVSGLLDFLGTSAESVSVDPETVTREASEAVRFGLADTWFVPLAVFTESSGHRFRTAVTRAEATHVVSARRFARDAESLLVVDADWSLTVDCLFRDAIANEGDPWGVVRGVGLTGRIQVYIPEGDLEGGRGELIAARLRSDKNIGFLENGDPLIIETEAR